jgi:WD40 repeat protein
VRVWDIARKCQLISFNNHSGSVMCLAKFSENLFISGSFDCSMIMWDSTSLEISTTFISEKLNFFDSAINENYFAYPSGNSVKLWNLNTECLISEFQGHSSEVLCVALHYNLIISGGRDCTVCVWDINTSLQTAVLEGHSESVLGVAMCGDIIASASDDKTVILWDLRKYQMIGILSGHTCSVWSVVLNRNGQIVASGSADNTVRVWSVSKLQLISVFNGHRYPINKVCISSDDKFLISGSVREEIVRVWDIDRRTEIKCWKSLSEGAEWWTRYPELRQIAEKIIP